MPASQGQVRDQPLRAVRRRFVEQGVLMLYHDYWVALGGYLRYLRVVRFLPVGSRHSPWTGSGRFIQLSHEGYLAYHANRGTIL